MLSPTEHKNSAKPNMNPITNSNHTRA